VTAEGWRESWDRQQSAHEPDRGRSFEIMLDWVELLVGQPCRVLDLACGTGSITERVLARFPSAQAVALDVDPVMLELVGRAFAGDARVEVLDRDLREASWREGLDRGFDVVLSATALHWLSEEEIERLYRGLAEVVRPGGVFANRDHYPIEDPRLTEAAERALDVHLERELAAGAESYERWYQRLSGDEDLRRLLPERARRFGERRGELWLAASWHRERLLAAGFAAVDVVWRWGNDGLLVAVR
jgi:SAM-dependent methyltransferase